MTESSTVFCYADIGEQTGLMDTLARVRNSTIDGHEVLGVIWCQGEQSDHVTDDQVITRHFGINIVLEGDAKPRDLFGTYWVGPHAQLTLCGRSYPDDCDGGALLPLIVSSGPGKPDRTWGYKETVERGAA